MARVMSSVITESAVREALSRVEDPEIGRPITELNMVKSVSVTGNDVAVEIYLLSLIHISEPTRHFKRSRMPSSA